jgi:hypothetical protein
VGPLFEPSELDDPDVWTVGTLPGHDDPAYWMWLPRFSDRYLKRNWQNLHDRYFEGRSWKAVESLDMHAWDKALHDNKMEIKNILNSGRVSVMATAIAIGKILR